jgi:hypothetical protein
MARKIAIAIIHGLGTTPPGFADSMIAALKEDFARIAWADADAALSFQPVHWSPVLKGFEDELWRRVARDRSLRFAGLRRLVVGFAADALAYQPADGDNGRYAAIHAVVARTLHALAAIDRAAPLVVIAHSLGSVIACDHFRDLARESRRLRTRVWDAVNPAARGGPLEKGETLTCLYTLGCPLPLWSLRYDDLGSPIAVPSPRLARHHPRLPPLGGWENYYDTTDILSFPLRHLSPAYAQAVRKDAPVDVGSLLTSWNPLAHTGYWTAPDVIAPIARRLAALWEAAQ